MPAMPFQDLIDLDTHGVLSEDFWCDSEADWHDLNRNYADLVIAPRIDIGQKVDVRIQTNTNAMDEKDWKLGAGTMGPVPIGESARWRSLTRSQIMGTEWEHRKVLPERNAVVVEVGVPQTDGSENIDKRNNLFSASMAA